MIRDRARDEAAALASAIRLLTRWRVGPPHPPHPPGALTGETAHSVSAVRYYPLAGALVGAFAAGVFWLAHFVFPVTLAVVLATAASLLATGALHEDGFADACDGLGGGADRERALAIMRDSRLGTYGALGVALLLAAKVLALAAAPPDAVPWLLFAAHATSRASMAVALATGTYARADGMAAPLADGRVGAGGVALALLTGAAAAGPLLSVTTPATLLAGVAGLAAGHLVMRRVYERKLGGYTGDCLGAVQQTSELGLYLGAAAALPLSSGVGA